MGVLCRLLLVMILWLWAGWVLLLSLLPLRVERGIMLLRLLLFPCVMCACRVLLCGGALGPCVNSPYRLCGLPTQDA